MTCPEDAFQIAVPICSATAKEYAIPIEIPVPVKEKIVPVVLSNTGNTQLTIEKVFRCRRDKGL